MCVRAGPQGQEQLFQLVLPGNQPGLAAGSHRGRLRAGLGEFIACFMLTQSDLALFCVEFSLLACLLMFPSKRIFGAEFYNDVRCG